MPLEELDEDAGLDVLFELLLEDAGLLDEDGLLDDAGLLEPLPPQAVSMVSAINEDAAAKDTARKTFFLSFIKITSYVL